jgi:hypothetical protein
MKKVYYLTIMLLFLFGFAGGANAALVDQGGGVIYDNTYELYWIQDLSTFNSKTYSQQITAIGNLEDHEDGGGAWRMASAEDMATLWTYDVDIVGGIFSSSWINSSNGIEYWVGRYDEASSSTAHYAGHISQDTSDDWTKFDLGYTTILDAFNYPIDGAWVASGTAVPIPPAVLLLASGLFGLVGIRWFRNRG